MINKGSTSRHFLLVSSAVIKYSTSYLLPNSCSVLWLADSFGW